MALGLVSSSGKSNSVRYDAKARVVKVGRESGDTEYETSQFGGIFDFPNTEVGWVSFQPFDDSHLVRHADVAAGKVKFPKRPGDGYRSGFRIRVKLAKALGGEVKEFMSAAMVTCQGIDELHDAYLAATESQEGKLPVVVIASTEAIKGKEGTNYRPKFAIQRWVERPADLQAPHAHVNVNGNGKVDDDVDDDIPFDAPPQGKSTSVAAEPEF